jgi:hypothetical protein
MLIPSGQVLLHPEGRALVHNRDEMRRISGPELDRHRDLRVREQG